MSLLYICKSLSKLITKHYNNTCVFRMDKKTSQWISRKLNQNSIKKFIYIEEIKPHVRL